MVSAILLQVMTEGPIERILYGNPQVTYFKSVYKRPTNFATKYSVKTPHGNIDWGNIIEVKIPREADLLGGINIRVKLSDLIRKQMYIYPGGLQLILSQPSQESLEALMRQYLNDGLFDSPNTTVSGTMTNAGETTVQHTYTPQHTSFCNGIGSVLIEYISLYSGSKLLETLTGEYIFLENELHNQGNSKTMFYDSVGFHKEFKIGVSNISDLDLIIPIPFFFTKDSGSHLPIMAMNNEEVTIRIKIRSFEECIIHQYQLAEKYGNSYQGNNSDGLCGYVMFLASSELAPSSGDSTQFPTNPDGHLYIPSTAGYNQQPIIPVDKHTPFKENVTSNIEIFEIIYKYYHISHDEQVNLLKNKHNYIVPLVKEINYFEFISGSNNSVEIPLEFMSPTKYFIFILQRKTAKNDHDYYNYTTDNKLLPSVNNSTDGLTLNADHNNKHILERFNLSLDGVDLLDNIPAKLLNNIELLTKFKNNSTPLLYVYSFAMDPTSIHPSGTLNFSNFLKQFVRLVTVDSSKFDSDNLIFRGYYVSYNVLTIADGLSGLRYV
jgi:hypothetical protein